MTEQTERLPQGMTELIPERGVALDRQLYTYLSYLYSNIELDPSSQDLFPDTENIKAEIERKGVERGIQIVERNNAVAQIINSPEYKAIHERQIAQKGNCALGVSECIDGRLPRIHLWGLTAGVQESLAGVLSTRVSLIDGRVKLRSQTLEQSIAARPSAGFSQLLQVSLAHSECGAMNMWSKQREENGNPFPQDNLIDANYELYSPGTEAITRIYNNSATSQEKPPLKKIGIRLYYDTDTMGLTLDPTSEDGKSVSTSDTVKSLRKEFEAYDSKYKDNFDDLEVLLSKERDQTDLVDLLFQNDRFNRIVQRALERSQELHDLTPEQQQAFRYIWARFTALQILTGTYKGTERNENHVHVEQPFAHHNESYMSVTVDDGLNVIVGQFDPEVQVFGATVPNAEEAVNHITTEDMLMDKRGEDTKPPRVLFISAAMAEDSNDPASYKKARANVANAYRQIVETPQMAKLILSGKIIPIPVIIKNRSAQIVGVPNLAL